MCQMTDICCRCTLTSAGSLFPSEDLLCPRVQPAHPSVRRPTSGRRETLTLRRRPRRPLCLSLHGALPSSPSFSLCFPPHLLFLTNIRLGPLSLSPWPRDVTGKRLRERVAVDGAEHRSTIDWSNKIGLCVIRFRLRRGTSSLVHSIPVRDFPLSGKRSETTAVPKVSCWLLCPRHGDGRTGRPLSHGDRVQQGKRRLIGRVKYVLAHLLEDRRKRETLHTGQWLLLSFLFLTIEKVFLW